MLRLEERNAGARWFACPIMTYMSDSTPSTIHMFWHGADLSRIERLCMSSFVANGARLLLHVYEEPRQVPKGVQIVAAEATIPRANLFLHRATRSLAPFADWFRYRVLAEHGGIWADTDVVCLRSFRFTQPEVFAWQEAGVINNAVLGFRSGHPLAVWMADACANPNNVLPYDSGHRRRLKWRRRFLQGNRRGNISFGEYGPFGLTRAIRHFDLTARALPYWSFYPIHPLNWHCVFD